MLLSSLVRSAFNTAMLVVGVAIVMLTWRFVDASNDIAMNSIMSSVSGFNPLDFFGIVWLGIRILFWLIVALGVTAIVIGVLLITGVLAWFAKQMGVAIGYLVGFIRNQYSATVGTGSVTSGSTVGAMVVGEDEDGPVTLLHILGDHERRHEDTDTHIDEIIERIEILEGRYVQNPTS